MNWYAEGCWFELCSRHHVSFSNTKGDFGQVCPAGFCLYDISQSSLTFRRFMTLFDDAFEAYETLVSLTDVV